MLQQLARGVYTAPYLSETGKPVVIAIDDGGRLRASVEVSSDPLSIVAHLRSELERLSPPA